MKLIVTIPFVLGKQSYAKGEAITDAKTVKTVMDKYRAHVVPVNTK